MGTNIAVFTDFCYFRTMIRISLIIPTHNRSAQLIAALESVVKQTLPTNQWECIVVNNRSTDDTAERFAEFAQAHHAYNLRMVEESEAGVSYARNRGVTIAHAPLLAFIDDDERITSEFLEAYLSFFEDNPQANVAGGKIIAEYPEGRPTWLSKYTEMPIANPMDFGSEPRPFPTGRVPGGGNMAFRREAFAICGGFDPSLGRIGRELIGGEENDLFERLLQAGEIIWYVPKAVMWHIIPATKLSDSYFRRLCHNVGVSQRIRARIHDRLFRARLLELAKWGATLLLCCTLRPAQSAKLLHMRLEISRGLFANKR